MRKLSRWQEVWVRVLWKLRSEPQAGNSLVCTVRFEKELTKRRGGRRWSGLWLKRFLVFAANMLCAALKETSRVETNLQSYVRRATSGRPHRAIGSHEPHDYHFASGKSRQDSMLSGTLAASRRQAEVRMAAPLCYVAASKSVAYLHVR